MRALLAAFVVGLWALHPARSQVYPAHPITIVVPFAPTDVLPRMLSEALKGSCCRA